MRDPLRYLAARDSAGSHPGSAPCPNYKERRRRRNPDRRRHGARNQDKSKIFVRWLAETFPREVKDDARPIMDVAGGKGEVAARLCVCHNRRVIMVDPRVSDPQACFLSTVLRKLPLKWQQRLQQKEPSFLSDLFSRGFSQIATSFDATTIQQPQLQEAVSSSCLLVGLHADGATEAIVDVALKCEKPFVVVPCCVFPKLFPQRLIRESDGEDPVPVRTVEQFCRYLLDKDTKLQSATLPFEGRNVAIYWQGRD